MMELALIDGIGPFFRGYRKRRINWSKIPFAHLATDGDEREAQWAGILADCETFGRRVAAMGFNAVALDDVAHLTDDALHAPDVRERIGVFADEFRRVFAVFRGLGLRIFVTTDCAVLSAGVEEAQGGSRRRTLEWFAALVERFLDAYPEVDGVVLRIGESDGHDVEDPLRSRLLIRSAREANGLLKALLPAFERRGKTLVFRTWTVGAHLIGDLIWHRGRLAQALAGIGSDALVVSMKYGESDFFRYLPLNRQFFRVGLKKIIEFQARREYEGAGEFPSFIGWDCERYAHELAGAQNVVGLSVWCQTGGWHAFRRLAFLDEDAGWIELNTLAAIRVVRDGKTVEDAVEEWAGPERAAAVLELLRRSDETVRELLYIGEFARQKLFFRRVRIPPLLHVYWDCLFVNDAVRKTVAHFVRDPEAAIREGEGAFANFGPMEELAESAGLSAEDIRFMRDTFWLILLARRYYLLPFDEGLAEEIRAAKRAYKKAWPRSARQRYRIRLSFQPFKVRRRTIGWLSRIMVRRRRGYRTIFDRVFTLNLLSWCYRLFRVRNEKALPKMLRKTAMGVDALFK